MLDWEEKGFSINGVRLNHLRFADDVVLISKDATELQEMLQELDEKLRTVGLLIHPEKTKAMTNMEQPPLTLQGRAVEFVENFVNLGRMLNKDGHQAPEITRRIQWGWFAFHRYTDLLSHRRTEMKWKRKLFDSCVLPALL